MKRKITVTVHPSTGKNRDGDPTWGPNFEVKGVLSWPAESAELTDGGTITSDVFVYLPPRAPKVEATANITVKGNRYSVDGNPGDYEDYGKGQLIRLKRTGK